jgi:hypothetical protein
LIEMFVAVALVLLLVPLAALYVFERMACSGRGPLAESDRAVVLDGFIVPMAGYVPLLGPAAATPDPSLDAERCATESRIVASLMAGDLDCAKYQQRMAALAALDATTRSVRVPPEPS